jgi:hypothetical protein
MKQSNKDRLIKFRAKNLELGRKRREYYLTDSEHRVVKKFVNELREKNDE